MKVCLITGAFPPDRCGIGDYTDRLAGSLARLGTDIHVVAAAGHGETPRRLFSVHRVVRRWDLAGLRSLAGLLGRIAPDVVHLQFPSVAFRRSLSYTLAPAVLRSKGFRIVLTLHEYAPAGATSRLRQLAMAAAADRVILTNPEDLALVGWRLFWRRDRLHAVGIGPNIEPCAAPAAAGGWADRESRRRQAGVEPGSTLFCFFGNLHPGKGVEELVEAFAAVGRSLPGSRLLLIGSFDPGDAPFEQRVRRRIDAAGPAGAIRVTGFLPPREVSALLLASDVCVLPFRDGVSLRRGTLLAALCHGLTVITTCPRTPLPAELGGEVLILTPRGDAAGLARAMLDFAAAPASARARLRAGGLARRFTWEDIARRTLEVYGKL